MKKRTLILTKNGIHEANENISYVNKYHVIIYLTTSSNKGISFLLSIYSITEQHSVSYDISLNLYTTIRRI